jgi:hypothetical protein
MSEGVVEETTSEESGSEERSQYDHERHLLENPGKALEIAKKAESERDRMRSELEAFRAKAGSLAAVIDAGNTQNVVSWLNAHAKIRAHPDLQEVASKAERGEELPPRLGFRNQMNGEDNSYEEEPEPWQVELQKLRSELLPLRQTLQGIQSNQGLSQFQERVSSYFKENQPHLAEQDREQLRARVMKQVEGYSQQPGGVNQVLGMNQSAVNKFLNGELMEIPGAYERALENKRVAAAREGQHQPETDPIGIRATSRAEEPTQPNRVTLKDVERVFRRAEDIYR